MTERDDESAKVHEPKVWDRLRKSLKSRNGGVITLNYGCTWADLEGSDDDAFRHGLAESDAYAVFFIRALIGNPDQVDNPFNGNDVEIKRYSIVIPSALVGHLTNTTDEAFIGADLVARVALTVARRISKTCRNNFTPRLDCYKRPSEVTEWQDLRFLSADFVVAAVKEHRDISPPSNSGKNGGACCPDHYYHFGWVNDNPPKETWKNRGWRMGSEREFANDPNQSREAKNKIETFLGFPAFFKHDEANVIFALPPVNGEETIKTPSGCSSHETLFNLGIKPYVEAKQREYAVRQNYASAPNGCIVLCLGVSDQRAAYFDPDRFKNAYAVFLTIDLECNRRPDGNGNGLAAESKALDLQAIIDDLKNSRYQIKYKTLQVLTGKLLSDVKNYLELEKRHGRILAQIQQPLQSIVESLIGAQASVQRINATLRPALAQDVAADAALQAALLREDAIVPSLGEEGAAV